MQVNIRNDFDAELHTRVTRTVRDSVGVNESIAAHIASTVLGALARELSGEKVYFRKRVDVKALIRAEYDGRNAAALARKHHVSRATVFRALNEEQVPAEIENGSNR